MKQRITMADLAQLSHSQKVNLRALWRPIRYEIAIASVCVNAETEEYVDIEFSIGGVHIKPNGAITIRDLRALDGYHRIGGEDSDFLEPTAFPKEQCLPLLSIGEMIDIMDSLNFRNYHFYLLAGTGVTGCEVGHFRSIVKDKILNEGFQNDELCVVLWQMIVAQL